MINPFKEVNWHPNRAEKRRFASSLAVGFPILALVLLLLGRWIAGSWSLQLAAWLGGLGAAAGGVLWLFPGMARPFYVVWFALACSIGIIISNTLLIGFYFTIMTGFGLAMRLLGRKPLKPLDKKVSSYWEEAEEVSDVERYYRQF